MGRFDSDTYREWREAYAEGRIEPALVEFVNSVAAVAVAVGGISANLAPGRQWNAESTAEAVQAWWDERLMTSSTLGMAFREARDARGFSRYLEQAFRNWLIDRARSSHVPRLRARAKKILREDERFTGYGGEGTAEQWGLAEPGWEERGPYQGDEDQLAGELYALGEVELLPPSTGLRADAVLSNEELTRLLLALFERVGVYLTVDELGRALRRRFVSFYPPHTVEIGEETEALAEPSAAVPDAVDARERARRILQRLSGRQFSILKGRFIENQTLEQLAEANGCSRGTADNELTRAAQVMRDEIGNPEDTPEVWKQMLEIAS